MEKFTWAETEVTVTPAVDLTVRTVKSPIAGRSPRVDCSDWPGCSEVGGKEPIEITPNLCGSGRAALDAITARSCYM